MYELKPISKDAIPAALEKAHRYRVINESLDAESICRDVLKADPDNREALVTLLLALSDQFDRRLGTKFKEAHELLEGFDDDYAHAYYEGILFERRAKSNLRTGKPGSSYLAYESFLEAMKCFEKAIELRPANNDEAILRWNTCARILNRRPDLKPDPNESEPSLDMLE